LFVERRAEIGPPFVFLANQAGRYVAESSLTVAPAEI